MNIDIVRELQQIQRYAAGLHDLLAQAQAQAPLQADGADSSGAVRVVLGPDGLPKTIRVEQDWQRRLAPDGFGAAVGEAFSAAMGQRLAAWTETLQRQGWQSGVDRLRAASAASAVSSEGAVGAVSSDGAAGTADAAGSGARSSGADPAAPGLPPALAARLGRGGRNGRPTQPRPLDTVAEDMIKAFGSLDRVAAPPAPAAGTGSAAGGRLSITLSASGGLSCTAEPQWVSRQSPASLMSALSEALRAARTDLAQRSAAAAAAPAAPLDRLLGEAFALLADPRRTAES